MNKSDFYKQVSFCLNSMGFSFHARENVEGWSKDSAIRIGIDILGKLASMPAVASGLHPTIVKSDIIHNDLEKIYEYAELVCYRFVATQPEIVAFIDTEYMQKRFVELSVLFDQSVLAFRKYTGRLGVVKLAAIPARRRIPHGVSRE